MLQISTDVKFSMSPLPSTEESLSVLQKQHLNSVAKQLESVWWSSVSGQATSTVLG